MSLSDGRKRPGFVVTGAVLSRARPLIRVQVDLGCCDLFVAEPERDHRGVDAGAQQAHGRGMPQHMHGHPLARQGPASDLCVCVVLGQPALNRIAAERASGPGWKQRVRRQTRRTATTPEVSGVILCFRPEDRCN